MSNAPTHAGAVVFREDGGERRFLLVRSSSGTGWVLPKGHIEHGETLEETARREVLEEAGATVEILQPIGVIEIRAKQAVVAYFTARFKASVHSDEQRKLVWLALPAAQEHLVHDNARAILGDADRTLGIQSGSDV
jgi:8-oxo-dGTP pyrophosphatase MutT (NUDIX family)